MQRLATESLPFLVAQITQPLLFLGKPKSDYYTWVGEAYVHGTSGNLYRDIEEGEPLDILIC